MFERTRSLQKQLNSHARKRDLSLLHPSVGWFELYSVILTIPSMLIFFPGFILVAFNILVAKAMGKGYRKLSLFLLLVINVPYIPLVFLLNSASGLSVQAPVFVIALVPTSLITFGGVAWSYQNKQGN